MLFLWTNKPEDATFRIECTIGAEFLGRHACKDQIACNHSSICNYEYSEQASSRKHVVKKV